MFADLVREMNEGLIVPVFFGSAQNGFGVRRLLKALRRDAAHRDGRPSGWASTSPAPMCMKTAYAGQAGKLAYARVFGAKLADGADLVTARRPEEPRRRAQSRSRARP